ncbi:MAG: RsmB/NOP family class I SAM-dependent RNA methyltransferase [Clostridiales bacterium]|nr:RsmB/NOP family class I SAM-dependent RNA methyltransferase [Clostridiales bacterium]
MNLPDQFVTRMKKQLGQEFEAYLASFEEKRVYGLRVNPLKIARESFVQKGIFSLEQVAWCEDGYYYPQTDRPSKHPYYHAGLYYLQEPSAMAPAAMLPVEKGDRILDLCAAPGGKSTQLGARLQDTGVLVSNDISIARTKALLKNIELFGIRNAIVTSEPPERLVKKFAGYFDKIIIDAPCSGEGMFRKDPDVAKSWGDEMSEFCQTQQRQILSFATQMLRAGGYILYSTCTFDPAENEKAVNDFLNDHDDFEICPLEKVKGFDTGHPEWIENGRQQLTGCARLWPHRLKGEGHFLALLRNTSDPVERTANYGVPTSSDSRLKFFEDFCREYLSVELKGRIEVIQDHVHLIPWEVPDLHGLRIVRSGWFLGELKKNRFEPSQSLAMGLRQGEFRNTANFSADDPRLIRYLKGESIELDGPKDGWCLVTVDDFPVGWAKMQKGRLKNKYLAGWKME